MGKISDRRLARVTSLVRRTLDELIRTELQDPRLGLVCLTEVQLSPDLSSAEVWVAVVDRESNLEQACAVLNQAAPLLWNRLREETDLRIIPRMRFVADRRGEYVDQIEQLLKQIPPPADGVEQDDGEQRGK